jgi:oligopeptide transport system substrate-binding protein
MLRNLLGLLAAFAVALILVGLTFSAVREDRADVVVVNGTEPKSIDPAKMTGVPEGRIADALFEGLTFRDNDTLEARPGSALSWDLSADGLRWTFTMRPEARWTDGVRVTAGDFAWSWVRLQEPRIASEYAYLLHGIRHAEAYNTFGDQAEALRGKPGSEDANKAQGILAGLRALVGDPARPLDTAAWQTFLDERKVREVVVRTRERALADGMDRRTGAFTAVEAAALLAALEADAARRERELAEAKAHFGRDQGVFAPDDDTFVVELVAPIPYFLDLTSFHAALPVPRRAVEADPESWFLPGRIVSNGAYRLETWSVNRKIRLVRSETYWGRDQVSLATVEFLPTENSTTALNLYMTGDADWLPGNYPPDLIDRLRERPDFQSTAAASVYFYRFNCTRKPFDDWRVRLALSKAVDRNLLVTKVTRKFEPVALTIVPPMAGYEPPESRGAFDVAAARKLLAEAGYPEGRGFPEFALLYNTHEGHRKYAEFVADQWRRNLGVRANSINAEWQSYLKSQQKLDYDVCRAGWVADYVDPNTFLDLWVTKGGNNNTGWSDALYDRLVSLAADPPRLLADKGEILPRLKEPEKAKKLLEALEVAPEGEARVRAGLALRMHLFREAEAILFQDAFPVLPLFVYVNTGLVAPRLENFRKNLLFPDGTTPPNLQDLHPLRDLRVRREAR